MLIVLHDHVQIVFWWFALFALLLRVEGVDYIQDKVVFNHAQDFKLPVLVLFILKYLLHCDGLVPESRLVDLAEGAFSDFFQHLNFRFNDELARFSLEGFDFLHGVLLNIAEDQPLFV